MKHLIIFSSKYERLPLLQLYYMYIISVFNRFFCLMYYNTKKEVTVQSWDYRLMCVSLNFYLVRNILKQL